MAIVAGSNTFNVDDRSRAGCKTRRAVCTGLATSRDAKKSTAVKEANAEAKRQKDLAVAEAVRTISCPDNDCTGSKICRQVGQWYSQGQTGSVVKVKKAGANWEAKAKKYTEKRLKCRCRAATTSRRNKKTDANFSDISEYVLFG